MIVRIVTYGAKSVEAVTEWHRDRAPEIEAILGLERVEFVRRDRPLRAGAIMYFESPEDLRAYRESQRFDWLQESIRRRWVDASEPTRDVVYRTLEEPSDSRREP